MVWEASRELLETIERIVRICRSRLELPKERRVEDRSGIIASTRVKLEGVMPRDRVRQS